MNDWYTMSIMTEERRDDLRRHAEIERVFRQAFREGNRRRGFRDRLLCGLGRRLAALGALGAHLQEAYGNTPEAPALRPTHPRPA